MKKNFTPMQRTAILNPCEHAWECANRLYQKTMVPWSVILTVNVGEE